MATEVSVARDTEREAIWDSMVGVLVPPAANDVGQSSGRAPKSRLACLYHPIPEMGCFHRPFISFEAGWCSSSPPLAISLRWRSWAFMTSSAVAPWWAKSHGPPSCLHVIVFMCRFLSVKQVAAETARNMHGPAWDACRYQAAPAGCLVVALSRLNRLVVATHRTRPAICFSSKCFAASSHTWSGTGSGRSARRVMDSARARAALSASVKRSVSRQAATAKSRSSLSPAFLALMAPP
jgi:hypothetical protein